MVLNSHMAAVALGLQSGDRPCSVERICSSIACGTLRGKQISESEHFTCKITNNAQVTTPVYKELFRDGTGRLGASHEQYELPTFQARNFPTEAEYLHSAFRVRTTWCLRELDGARAAAGDDVRRACLEASCLRSTSSSQIANPRALLQA
jgi:hypothetical protein